MHQSVTCAPNVLQKRADSADRWHDGRRVRVSLKSGSSMCRWRRRRGADRQGRRHEHGTSNNVRPDDQAPREAITVAASDRGPSRGHLGELLQPGGCTCNTESNSAFHYPQCRDTDVTAFRVYRIAFLFAPYFRSVFRRPTPLVPSQTGSPSGNAASSGGTASTATQHQAIVRRKYRRVGQ